MNSYYELTYIISPVLEDEQYPAVIQRINDLITSSGGAIDEVEEWGLRKFAYEMDKKQTGFYVNLYFEGPATAIEPIERAMRIDGEIMRYLTLKYDAKRNVIKSWLRKMLCRKSSLSLKKTSQKMINYNHFKLDYHD